MIAQPCLTMLRPAMLRLIMLRPIMLRLIMLGAEGLGHPAY